MTDLSERDVTAAIERLSRRGLVGTTSGSGHRVAKFRHNLDRALDLSARELAALAVLMLRGPQTPGEVRSRSGRMAEFADVSDAEEALWLLGDRDEPLAVQLPRAPGQSADRYAHVLSGEPDPALVAEARARRRARAVRQRGGGRAGGARRRARGGGRAAAVRVWPRSGPSSSRSAHAPGCGEGAAPSRPKSGVMGRRPLGVTDTCHRRPRS